MGGTLRLRQGAVLSRTSNSGVETPEWGLKNERSGGRAWDRGRQARST